MAKAVSDTPARMPEEGEYVRGLGKLVAVSDPPPVPPPPKDYIFETISARGEVRRNGRVWQGFGELWDFHGLGTSVSECIKDMRKVAAREGFGPNSELEVVVVKIVSYQRLRPTAEANVYDRRYLNFAPTAAAQWNVPEPVESVVWSSFRPEMLPE